MPPPRIPPGAAEQRRPSPSSDRLRPERSCGRRRPSTSRPCRVPEQVQKQKGRHRANRGRSGPRLGSSARAFAPGRTRTGRCGGRIPSRARGSGSARRAAVLYSPGLRRAVRRRARRQSGPPWCGQRLRSAKNSPPTLKTPIERPATSTILRVPGGISSTVATTRHGLTACVLTSAPGSEPVERPRVLAP